jgi:peroxiredoxin
MLHHFFGLQVYGISADEPRVLAAWRKKEGIAFNLMCDPDKKVSMDNSISMGSVTD